MARIKNTTSAALAARLGVGDLGIMVPMTREDGWIERMEATGQQELCAAEQLPTTMLGGGKAAFEAMGIVIVGPTDGDDLFVDVKLPQGWTKRPTAHAMHSELCDAKGNVRAEIFYKAAFYDRRADIRPTTRFRIDYDSSLELCKLRGYVIDRGAGADGKVEKNRVIFTTEPATIQRKDDWAGREAAQKLVCEQAAAWLDARYPAWKSPHAHWEDAPLPTADKIPVL